ncbi:SCO family protein [Herbaspirillum sp. AP02]|uniref:SCO family protein n=1 Tax=unclassified Herbaspirillum TaxID=2624150 RepID=UPI0015DB30E1|nr:MULTISPECIES: SCO family protein [unclassified Herbaspirillum]MBG7618885.1 SCO family protein [Herbaspirillum sp. AP02]NZD67313.1 SCO family protein [Herbaspirillum sp. AP21]
MKIPTLPATLATMTLVVAALTGITAMAAAPQAGPASASSSPQGTVAAALPADSVYQLDARLTDQDGKSFNLAQRRGQPMLVGMFYTSCEFVCPLLVEALRNTEARLTAQERARLSVLLITIDPVRDTVAVLKRTASQREIEAPHWTLARSDAATTRKLAAVLGLQYRALPNGDFNHSTDLILLDAEGSVAARTAQLSGVDPEFLRRVKLSAQ